MSQINTLYVLSARSQPETLFRLLPIDKIYNNGYRVVYINVIELFPNLPQAFPLNKIHSEYIKYEHIKSREELTKILSFNNTINSLAILIGWPFNTTNILMSELKGSNIISIKFNLSPINKPCKLKFIYNLLKHKIKDQKIKPDIIIAEAQYKKQLLKSRGYKNIWIIHSHIYENYFQLTSSHDYQSADNFILYIDQNFMEHPDFSMFNIKKNDFTTYYKHIATLLKKFEKHYKLKIIVALHPTSNEKTYDKFFHNFTLMKDKTYDLINNAKYIIGHYSGVMDYAMLQNKKILSIEIPKEYSPKVAMNQKIYTKKTNIKSISHNTNKIPIFTSKSTPYDTFIHQFIKSKNSPRESFHKIFFSYLERFLNN